MKVSIRAVTVGLVVASSVLVAAQQPTDRQVLEQLKVIIDAQLTPPAPPPPPPPVPNVVSVSLASSIEAAYNQATVPTGLPVGVASVVLVLDPLASYSESVTLLDKPGITADNPLLITTLGYVSKGDGWDGMVRPQDVVNMATIQSPDANPGLWIRADHIRVQGIAFDYNAQGRATEIIRIGTDTETDPANAPQNIAINQVLVEGHPTTGQRRGIRVHGNGVNISQVYIHNIWDYMADSQAISADRGGWNVTIRFSHLEAASENFILGGGTAPAGFTPTGWLLEDVELYKPLSWQTDEVEGRVVKNLLELKHAKDVTIRRVLAVNNWNDGQDGTGVLLTYATNGQCPGCGGIDNVLIEDMVIVNTRAAFNFIGYSYQNTAPAGPPMNAKKLQNVTIRNVYVSSYGTGSAGRLFMFSNVGGAHNITVDRLTAINNGNQWFVGSNGFKWTEQPDGTVLREVGGPWQGFRFTNSVVTYNGLYGFTVGSTHNGAGIAAWIDDTRQIAANVFGDAPSSHINNYNQHTFGGEPNVSAVRADLVAMLPTTSCGTHTVPDGQGGQVPSGKGADCSRLASLFARLQGLIGT
jgi:hypothetical protein